MENNELLKRARDLAERCERSGTVCVSGFLSPAEQYELQTRLGYIPCGLVFHGGGENRERAAAFFLPDYMTEDMLDVSEYLCAMKLKAYFGQPGHRDYMGALLGMGIGREWLGDIQVEGDTAYVFCMKSVLRHLLSIEKAGRYTVKASQVPLEEVPARKVETDISFVLSRSASALSISMEATPRRRYSGATARQQILLCFREYSITPTISFSSFTQIACRAPINLRTVS